MIKCNVSNVAIEITETETLTAGRVGLECQFTFSSEWDGLAITAYFLGSTTKAVVVSGDTVAVPAESMAEPGYKLYVGVVGKNAQGNIVIPTLWASAGKIKRSPGEEEEATPSPDVVAQIQLMAINAVNTANAAMQVITDHYEEIEEVGTEQVAAVNSAGTTQTGNVNTAGAAQVAAVQAKGEEVLDSIPEDYTALSDDVDDLKSAFREYNIFSNVVETLTNVNWGASSGLGIKTGEFTIVRSNITAGQKYWFAKPNGVYPNAVRFADASGNYLGNLTAFATLVAIPDTAAFVYVKFYRGDSPIAVAASDYNKYTTGYKRDLIETYVPAASEALTVAQDTASMVNEVIEPSVNLADPSKFTRGKYMTETGVIGNNATYFYTDKIPVSEGDVLYYNSSYNRYVTAFNGDAVATLSSSNSPLTVPSGVDGLVFTGYMANIDQFMVSRANIPYVPYGDTINPSYISAENKNALNGNGGLAVTAESLAENTILTLSEYPKIIAAHDRLSGYCEFSTLGEIFFGYGYESNIYCGVDSANINVYVNGALSTSIPHGITVSDYLAFSIIMDDERMGKITINSTGGTATAEVSLGYNKNGLPFIRSTTALTNVKISAICKDIKNPIWWFGDSYSSLAPERIIGQLDSYGVIGNMLIDAVPGGRTYYNAETGGYVEFQKLVKLSKPKYIIWALGMNDTIENYQQYLSIVKSFCELYGIVLYAVKIPSVPNIDNTSKNAYIDTLGLPAIDWAKAVNATAQGVWYSGYLSDDNVHPTVKGAQAMAARTLVDCPAIMQF